MAVKQQEIFQFGDFRVDALARTLRRDEEVVTLNRRAFDVLLYFVQNPGRVLSRDELLKNVWQNTFVDENSLAQSISALRRALEEKPGDNSYIVTLPGRGYQFVLPVKLITPEGLEIAPAVSADGGSRPVGVVLQRESIQTSITMQEEAAHRLPASGRAWVKGVIGVLCIAIIVGAILLVRVRSRHRLTAQDTVVLADFINRTGDEVFDDTLKTALGIALDQTAFLHTLSENKVRQGLRLMARAPDTKITSDVAREICQRTGGKAYIAGSIAQLGSQYVLTLQASSCQSGDTMAREQMTASAKEGVLDALGRAAAQLRSQLGESLVTAQKFDAPLVQVTTPSLEALKAFSLGQKFLYWRGPPSAIPYFQRALELDPNFAMAYVELGNAYFGLNERGRASEYFAKAFSLREHTSELEKLHIAAEYYGYTTGELDKAMQALQEDIEYKGSSVYLGLTDVYSRLGQYDKSAEAARTLLARDPENSFGFVDLAIDDLALQDFSGAQQVIEQARERGLDGSPLHYYLYILAFLKADSAGMAEQEEWFARQPIYENAGLALAADTEAYAGHVRKAHELTRLASESAARVDNQEDAVMYRVQEALAQAAYGNAAEARQAAAEALKLTPGNPGVAAQAALIFGMTGETARAASLAQDLGKRFSLDTQMQMLVIPAIQAQLQLGRHEPELALNTLRPGLSIELANTTYISCLEPVYIRGQAYLAAGQGAPAAIEFQKIIDHSGIVANCWTSALAHLGVARANTLQAKNFTDADAEAARLRAVAAYKDFLGLWKDADPDIPILKQAKAEYAKL